LEEIVDKLPEHALISVNTPLIANLDMLENIAIIHEVHKHKSIKEAQFEALEYLNKIAKADIGLKRMHQINEVEMFYVMVARAMMSEPDTVVLINPLAILNHVEFLAIAMKNLAILNDNKNIIILENGINRFHYEGMWVFDDI